MVSRSRMPPPSWTGMSSPTALTMSRITLLVLRAAGRRAVQVDDVQAARALRDQCFAIGDRVVGEDGRVVHVALLQAHAAAVLQVDRRNDEHAEAGVRAVGRSGSSEK